MKKIILSLIVIWLIGAPMVYAQTATPPTTDAQIAALLAQAQQAQQAAQQANAQYQSALALAQQAKDAAARAAQQAEAARQQAQALQTQQALDNAAAAATIAQQAADTAQQAADDVALAKAHLDQIDQDYNQIITQIKSLRTDNANLRQQIQDLIEQRNTAQSQSNSYGQWVSFGLIGFLIFVGGAAVIIIALSRREPEVITVVEPATSVEPVEAPPADRNIRILTIPADDSAEQMLSKLHEEQP
jgi:small-conductance mechanosensitive channel